MYSSVSDQETFFFALSRRDPAFEGIFVVGVKTTGVFCRPTCSARMPKRENVEFFRTAGEALFYGYRPCKICSPLEYPGAAPSWIRPLLGEITRSPARKLTDQDLRERGLEPHRVRYWFKKQHKMTFQQYMRSLRVGQAFAKIKQGGKVADVTFESGYRSLSGFADSFKKTAAFSPSTSHDHQLIQTRRIVTPLGPMLAGANDDGICLLDFMDARGLQTEINSLTRYLDARLMPGTSSYLDILNDQLEEYFSGNRKNFNIPLVLPGTPFQKRVWAALQNIAYGSACSCRQQAESIGVVSAVRSVARANAASRIAILVPTHRVVGRIGGASRYTAGSWRKRFLLKLESSNIT